MTLTPGTTDELITRTQRSLWQFMQSLAVRAGGIYESLTPWTILPKAWTDPVRVTKDLEGLYETHVLALILDPP